MSLWFGNVQSYGLSVAWTYGDSVEDGTNPKTWASVPIGNASFVRMVVVCVKGDDSSGHPTSVTIGGVSASSVASVNNTSLYNSMWAAKVPTGTTGSVVVTWPGTPNRQGVSVYVVQGVASITPSATASDTTNPYTQSLSIPANGVAIGCGMTGSNGSATWTNLTENFDYSGNTLSTASTTATAAVSPSITFVPTNPGNTSMLLASWGP